jgi:hypothetical protein
MDPMDGDSPHDRVFGESRALQMHQLERLLIDDPSTVVNPYGAPGSGKTALAVEFTQRHRQAFPGGTIHLTALGELRDRQSSLDRLGRDAPSLIVFDEFQYAAIRSIGPELDRLAHERPMSRVRDLQREDLADTVDPRDRDAPSAGGIRTEAVIRRIVD